LWKIMGLRQVRARAVGTPGVRIEGMERPAQREARVQDSRKRSPEGPHMLWWSARALGRKGRYRCAASDGERGLGEMTVQGPAAFVVHRRRGAGTLVAGFRNGGGVICWVRSMLGAFRLPQPPQHCSRSIRRKSDFEQRSRRSDRAVRGGELRSKEARIKRTPSGHARCAS